MSEAASSDLEANVRLVKNMRRLTRNQDNRDEYDRPLVHVLEDDTRFKSLERTSLGPRGQPRDLFTLLIETARCSCHGASDRFHALLGMQMRDLAQKSDLEEACNLLSTIQSRHVRFP